MFSQCPYCKYKLRIINFSLRKQQIAHNFYFKHILFKCCLRYSEHQWHQWHQKSNSYGPLMALNHDLLGITLREINEICVTDNVFWHLLTTTTTTTMELCKEFVNFCLCQITKMCHFALPCKFSNTYLCVKLASHWPIYMLEYK
jgi:hypothetical protein